MQGAQPNQNPIQIPLHQVVNVTAAQFAAKYQEKREVYRFVASECGGYLPDYDNVTVWHLRDLVAGRRTLIKAQNIKHLHVPHFKKLAIKHMMEYCKGIPKVMKAFPSEAKEIEKLPRQYIINVIFTLVGSPFEVWVNQRIEERHRLIAEDRDLNIELDPDIAAIFQASNSVSGKYQFPKFSITVVVIFCSFEGKLPQLDESYCQKEKVQEADRGGEGAG